MSHHNRRASAVKNCFKLKVIDVPTPPLESRQDFGGEARRPIAQHGIGLEAAIEVEDDLGRCLPRVLVAPA
jgi:hypothetical protein